MPPAGPNTLEWRRGWRVVLGTGIASATSASLLYYVFSLFIIPIQTEFGASRGEMATVGSLVALGAIAAPLCGLVIDRFGARPVMAVAMGVTAALHLVMATLVDDKVAFAIAAGAFGVFGVGTGPVAYTRLINAWFDRQRGLALGVASMGLSIAAVIAPPGLAMLIEAEGWRTGYYALAGLALFAGLPAILMLLTDAPKSDAGQTVRRSGGQAGPALRSRDFWLLAFALAFMAIPGSGFLSQMSPLVQEEGVGAAAAAIAVSAYAAGQIVGRLIAGAMLDRYSAQWVAFLFTAVPAIGFAALAATHGTLAFALFAAAMIGVQQGAETDLFAYFVSRRFGLANYGAIYGALIGLGWIGTAGGVIGFGWSHDATGSYQAAQIVGVALFMVAAVLIAAVKVGRHDPDL
jgi:MFS family permease